MICSYGPPECQPRKTLLQWSYGTTFEGGPSGWDEPLITDRPDFTEASTTVGLGVRQLEYGYTYIYDVSGGVSTREHSFPETLLRYGILADWLELRLGWNYSDVRMRGPGSEIRTDGALDMYVGFKVGLAPQEGVLPELAVNLQAFVPTGAGAFTADETLPGVAWLYSWELAEWVTLGANTNFNKRIDDNLATYLEVAQSVTLAYTFTDNLGGYTEWYAFFPSGSAVAPTEHIFDGGFTYLLNNNNQLDIRAGVGLNDAAPDFFIGAGHSVRF